MTPICRLLVACILSIALAETCRAQTTATGPALKEPHPWQDDAALRAVKFIGTQTGYACGDHGTLWKSLDGGAHWHLVPLPTDASLRSLCFLTDKIGWVAGVSTQPFTGIGSGVLLKTTDGGRSWTTCGANLPPISTVKFFGLEEGIAVGEASSQFPTGILRTQDGGQTWEAAEGRPTTGWLAADFFVPEHGVVVGDRGRLSVVAKEALIEPKIIRSSLRAVRDVKFIDEVTGWAVGEGGLLLQTNNGGVSWQSPQQQLPEELTRFADWQAVAARDESVWVAGCPGGVIWHSANGGQHWERQVTSQSLPILAIHFADDRTGFAVGEFGTILRTSDSGRHWEAVRGGQRRAAWMTVHARPSRLPWNSLAKFSGEHGYRSVSLLLPRWTETGERDAVGPFERRAQAAVQGSGAQAMSLGWRLPIALPELDTHLDELTATWQKHTEGKLVEVLLSDLVCRLRQWRPSVVVLDEPGPQDAAGRLVFDAMRQAIVEAADPSHFPEHRALAGLTPWRVQRTVLQVWPLDTGKLSVDPFEVLPRLGTAIEPFVAPRRAMLFPTLSAGPKREVFRFDSDEKLGEDALAQTLIPVSASTAYDFWQGLALAPDSEARRPALPYDERRAERERQVALQQRNFRGITEKYLDQPQKAGALLAELRGSVKGLSRPQAVLQLMQLADEYRRRAQFDLAEATLIEVVDFYADEPAAIEAMLWLLKFWSSEEMAWQRSRKVSLTARREGVDPQAMLQRVQKVVEASGLSRDESPVPIDKVLLSNLDSQDPSQWRAAAEQAWQTQAIYLTRVLKKRQPHLAQSAEVQLPLSAALRRTGHLQMSEAIMRKLVTTKNETLLSELATTELWVSQPVDEVPQSLAVALASKQRPVLDGVLGDECWQRAKELPLASRDDQLIDFNGKYPFALLSFDEQFLYIAANLPRRSESTTSAIKYEGRQHDAVLKGHDRIAIRLDVNRDYATSYLIEVDQRGQVAESCWEDSSWNPKMFVAAASDAENWRVELAIPFQELVSVAPRRGTTWAVSVVRTIPVIGEESWPARVTSGTHPESIHPGLVQFR